MHKLFSLSVLLFIFSLTSLNAQQRPPVIYEDAEALTARYQLDATQQEALKDILKQRQDNFASIEDLLTSNELAYWQKRKNIYLGEQTSIRLILNTAAQLEAFAQRRNEVRVEESELIKSLIAQGYNKPEARLLLLQQKY